MKIEGHTFNETWLKPGSLVIDIGGNTGGFFNQMVQTFRCEVVCYEPDRSAFARLNALTQLFPPWAKFSVENKAVSSRNGTQLFYSAQPLNGGNSLIPGCREMGRYGQDETYEVQTVSFEEALAPYDSVDLVKMDAEGAEFGIIVATDPSALQKIKQFTIEFHDFAFEQFTIEDVDRCIKLLEGLGFKSKYSHDDPDKDYYFWRES